MVPSNEINDDGVAVHRDALVSVDGVDEGPLDFLARCVLGVQDAPCAVPTFTDQVELPVFITLEVDAEVQKVADAVSRFADHGTNHRFIARSGSCGQGVHDVCFDGFRGRFVENGCDASLRPIRG